MFPSGSLNVANEPYVARSEIGPGDPVGAVLFELRAGRAGMEHLGGLDAEARELVVRDLDVVHDQVQTARGAGRGVGDLRAELDRGARAGRRELDDAEAVVEREVGVEPPSEALVERLRAVGVGDGNHDDLELHVGVGAGHWSTSGFDRNENAAAVAEPKTRCALRSFSSVLRSYFQICS